MNIFIIMRTIVRTFTFTLYNYYLFTNFINEYTLL